MLLGPNPFEKSTHEFKYIDPRAVDRYLGSLAPIGKTHLFALMLDRFLCTLNEGYAFMSGKGVAKSTVPDITAALMGVSDKLLSHTLNREGLDPWDTWNELDFDILHTCKPGDVSTSIRAYFHYLPSERKPHERQVMLHIDHHDIGGTQWRISVPIQILMKGWQRIPNEHIGYSHSIALRDTTGAKTIESQHNYVGVTRRSWLARMAEHFKEIRSGSNKAFHRAWRQYIGRHDVLLCSEIVTTNHTFDQIMAWEEVEVDRCMAAGNSLNMIPGGFKGIKFLHEHRLLKSTEGVTLKERERAIEAYQRINPRAGVPNLLISALWKDDAYAAKVICGVDGRLSVDQVLRIRDLNGLGIPVEKIAELVGARNVRQVAGVLAGEHYARIH